jgi:multidrug efflux pump subunit AcrA (membrane-fusion protein)
MTRLARFTRIALVMLAGGSLAACNAASAAAPSPSPSPSAAVETFVARSGSVRPTVAISGVLAPYRDIGVSAALNEPIVAISVHEGERVHAGQVLAVLESDDLRNSLAAAQQTAAENRARFTQQGYQSSVNVAQYASNVSVARAALAQSQAVLNQAQIDLHRYELLQRQGYLPDQTLEGQRVTVAADRQAVTAARAQLTLAVQNASAGGDARRAGIESAQISAMRAAVGAADQAVAQIRFQLARTVLHAPTDGVIASIGGAIGEYPSGRQLFTIHDDAQMYAMLAASGTQALALRGGEPATIGTTNGTLQVHGTVEAVLDQLSPGTTNFIVKVRIANGDHRLRAGIPVTARIALAPVTGTRVPVSAYADVTNGAVYAVQHGKLARRTVRTLATDGSAAIVEGVDLGARIVRDGQSGVAAGDAVGN